MFKGQGIKKYTLLFSADLGNVSNVEVYSTTPQNTAVTVTETRAGKFTGSKTFLMLNKLSTGLFDLRSNAAEIKEVVDKFFGIRCPASITKKDANTYAIYEFENECSSADSNIMEVAFCGKCSRPDQKILFSSMFIDISFRYVCFAYKVAKPITSVYYTLIDISSGREFTLPLSVRTVSDYK